MDYRDAGVDVEAGRAFVQTIRHLVESTQRPEVLGDLGGFSGCCRLPTGYQEPVLVAGTDGVGTKLELAQTLNQHATVGVDLVAMCVNDILTCGAEPLFFLDYLATGKLDATQLRQVVAGIAAGCRQAGCALLGGETAEMPGFYGAGAYDLAGFCVGIVERQRRLDGRQVQQGDIVIGLASQGIHSNGFSLVRQIVQATAQTASPWQERPAMLQGRSLAEVCLTPTRIYVDPVLTAWRQGLPIHGMAHITGGGLPENLPRCLGPGQSLHINPEAWPQQPIFQWLAAAGAVSPAAMFHTFNMGIGFVVLVPAEATEQAMTWFQQHGVDAYAIGEVMAGAGEILGLPQAP